MPFSSHSPGIDTYTGVARRILADRRLVTRRDGRRDRRDPSIGVPSRGAATPAHMPRHVTGQSRAPIAITPARSFAHGFIAGRDRHRKTGVATLEDPPHRGPIDGRGPLSPERDGCPTAACFRPPALVRMPSAMLRHAVSTGTSPRRAHPATTSLPLVRPLASSSLPAPRPGRAVHIAPSTSYQHNLRLGEGRPGRRLTEEPPCVFGYSASDVAVVYPACARHETDPSYAAIGAVTPTLDREGPDFAASAHDCRRVARSPCDDAIGVVRHPVGRASPVAV